MNDNFNRINSPGRYTSTRWNLLSSQRPCQSREDQTLLVRLTSVSAYSRQVVHRMTDCLDLLLLFLRLRRDNYLQDPEIHQQH